MLFFVDVSYSTTGMVKLNKTKFLHKGIKS